MTFLLNGLRQAVELLTHPTADLVSIIQVTLLLTVASTAIALVLGVPAGLGLGLGRFPGRRLLLAVVNAGLGLPPVVVGLVVALLLLRNGPLGSWNLLYTVRGMILAQVVLGLPVVVSLVASAAGAVEAGLLAQARALGASRTDVAVLVGREARAGVAVAAIAAMGSALSEVGAVVLVGGNIDLQTRTAAGAILTSISAGRYAEGIAVGILLLGMVFLLAAALTLVQVGGGSAARRSLAFGGR